MPTCGAHILGFCVFAENCSRFHAGSCSCAVAVVVVFCLAFCRGYTGSKFTVPMISCDVLDYDPVCEAGPRSMIDAKMLQELPKKKLGLFDN